MRVTQNTPDLLVLRFTRWKATAVLTVLTFLGLWGGWRIVHLPEGTFGWLVLWLFLTVFWTVLFALLFMERSMLVLNGVERTASLSHRTAFGLHRQHWPLDEVQSTRVTRHRPDGPADKDPKRVITLYVREGMDEGRHRLTNHTIDADAALAASAVVSDWMQAWRAREQKASTA